MTAAPHMTLSDDEIATLNAARDTLKAIADRALMGTPGVTSSQADGMIYAQASNTADAIFRTLNFANNWWAVEMTETQLHGKPLTVAS